MKQPKVSVIVPVYNTEKYLDKCFESLVNQTLQEIEIVVINDGSTDGSGAIIDRYCSLYPDKFLCFEKENGGQGAARNIGIEKCHGKYIGFLDSDDFVREEAFEKLYLAAETDKSDYVACGYTDFYEHNGKMHIINEYVASPIVSCPRQLFFDILVPPYIHLYNTRMVKESKIRFPEGYIYEDTAFFINLIPYIKTISCVNEPLPYRRRHKMSTTAIVTKDRVHQIFPIITNIINSYRSTGFFEAYEKEVEYFCARILLGSSMERISRINCREERKELIIETFDYLTREFPKYKKNYYFNKGMKNLVLKLLDRRNIYLYIVTIRIKNALKRGWR